MTAATALLALAGALVALHWITVGLALWHMRRRPPVPAAIPPITLLRPVCGRDPFDAETLASGLRLDPPAAEVIFCVARPDDPAVPLLRQLIAAAPRARARLLIGEDRITANPKLNNLAKGWDAATTDWIVMADSNLLLPRDYLSVLVAAWTPGTGLVSSPPAGGFPQGLAGRLECAVLNGNQARVQLAAAALGMGFAQGKTLFFNRRILARAGGLAALGADLAEDVAATRTVRRQGLAVRLPPLPFVQPIGRRNLREVWDRQLRWSRVRWQGFPAIFLAEPLNGPLIPTALAFGAAGPAAALAVPALWYAAEAVLARRAGWPMGPADLGATLLRDLMLSAIWVATFLRPGFTWRGTGMTVEGGRPVVQPARGGA